MAEKPIKFEEAITGNAPPWWPNFEPEDFSEVDLHEIERYCEKIIENVSKEKMTPKERWKVTKELGIPDRPLVIQMPCQHAVARVLDGWSDSLKPGLDMWWYPKLYVKANFCWVARFRDDWINLYGPWGFGTGWGGSYKMKLLPYASPAPVTNPVETEEDWGRIKPPEHAASPEYLWTLRKTKEFMKKYGVADIMPLEGYFCPDAYAGVFELIGLKNTMIYYRRKPDLIDKICKMINPLVIARAKAVLEAGSDFVSCCSWSGIAGLETYKSFDKYQLEVTKTLGASAFMWQYGFDQSSTLEFQCQTGSMPYGWKCTHETPIDIQRQLATKYKKVFFPFIDPMVAVSGPPDKITATVKNNIKAGAGPGYVFCHSAVDYWSKAEYIDLIMKTAKEYGAEIYKSLE